jgi:hypothetical protein
MARTRIYFDDPTTDKLLAMVLTLASEVWLLRERFAVIETLAGKHGVPIDQEVEDYEFDDVQAERLAQLRNDFIGNLFRILNEPVATSSPASRKRKAGAKRGAKTSRARRRPK